MTDPRIETMNEKCAALANTTTKFAFRAFAGHSGALALEIKKASDGETLTYFAGTVELVLRRLLQSMMERGQRAGLEQGCYELFDRPLSKPAAGRKWKKREKIAAMNARFDHLRRLDSA